MRSALLLAAVAVLAVGVTVTGCAVVGQPGGAGMMGAGPGGHQAPAVSCLPPASLPGTTVQVMLGRMSVLRAVPVRVAAGEVSFVVRNMGWRTHELVVLPLGAGGGPGERVSGADGTVDETSSVGEASSSCAAGAGEGITAGAVGWVTLTLPPGRYELVCNEPDHYADGMHAVLVVASVGRWR